MNFTIDYKQIFSPFFLLIAAFSLFACGGTSFQGAEKTTSENVQQKADANGQEVSSEPGEPGEPAEEYDAEEVVEASVLPEQHIEEVAFTCENMSEARTISAKENQEVSFNLSGEVCPTALSQDPRILFIVDVSGSMADQQDNIFGVPIGPVIPGADNFQNGTCGRYEAIKAILDKTKSGAATQTGRAGVILFGSAIHPNSIAFTSLADFETKLTPESICIAEDGTNYQQAFITAKDWLSAEDGMLKVAYFISDGMPTEINGNLTPEQAEVNAISVSAGQALTEPVPGLGVPKLFQVFLGTPGPESLVVMEEIAGANTDSIAEVEKASDLAEVLVDFSVLELEKANISLLVDATNPLEIKTFEQLETGVNGKWAWEADSLGIPGDVSAFQLQLSLSNEHIENLSYTVDFTINRE